MANIRPFRGWRYAPKYTSRISEFVSPLFDVISDRQRSELYRNKLNSIHLSVPRKKPFAKLAQTDLVNRKKNAIFLQDQKNSIYVYYQYFTLPSELKVYCQKGFIAMVKTCDWDENIVLRHENTIPYAVDERTDILRTTNLNVSPTHGLYTDTAKELEIYMDQAIQNPIYEIFDNQNVREIFASINAPEICAKFVQKLRNKQIILADGHHRYQASLNLRKERTDSNLNHTDELGYNFHMMYLTNTASECLRVLPTHRLVTKPPHFDAKVFFERLDHFFTRKEVSHAEILPKMIFGKKYTFGILTNQKAFQIKIKPKVQTLIEQNFTLANQTDTAVLHRYVLDYALGLPLEKHTNCSFLRFERNFAVCLHEVSEQKDKIAFITNGVTIEEIKNVCDTGEQMPQKSTYFYPKVTCGFVFGSIQEDEF